VAARKPARTIPFGPTGSADILQGFRPLGVPMDEMSLCLAEAARRLLRTEGTCLVVPNSLIDVALQLSLDISDGIPKMIREPEVLVGSDESVEIIDLVQIGGVEPDLNICWIPVNEIPLTELWEKWVHQIHDLMVAGYPGCVGCGGPGSEGDWDEMASRARTRVT